MEVEERRNRRRRQERVAIPLAQLGRLGSSSSRLASGSGSLSRQPSGSDAVEDDEASPQMGYFPPHSSSRRPKSGSSTSRPSSIHEDSSKDPFQYLTTGPRGSTSSAPKRHNSGQSDLSSMSRRGRPESSGWSQQGSSRRQSSDETSEELALVEEKSSRAGKGREEIVVELEPESPTGPEPASSRTRSASRKKPESASSRKTVSSRTTTSSGVSSGVRRKKRDDAR
ncbi:hypothetical protein BBK36DRAFT_1121813 [Trichoderma citrinoviride]|uniref:Uncharacterized protein n=1 Tax=Trichoderma citrinoviride TaxID=58853 RepID=A0A2T4B7M0_9HYPO|nr:hypothetical protein BBK36DRAFT_1121813 [Trichoderma citrinoviride]PTB65317.1 hypothetical protein BBK36DRAFT_1121813 [Trichoderma citrinoviride]